MLCACFLRVAFAFVCFFFSVHMYIYIYMLKTTSWGPKGSGETHGAPPHPSHSFSDTSTRTHKDALSCLQSGPTSLPSRWLIHRISYFPFALSLVHRGRKREILSRKCYTWATVCPTGKRLNVVPNTAPLTDNVGNIYPGLRCTQQPPVTCKSHYSPEANWFRVWRSTPSHGAQHILEILACTF